MLPQRLLSTAALLLAALLSACQSTPQADRLIGSWPANLALEASIDGLPFYPQEAYQCGPVALATGLTPSGMEMHPDELVSQVYVPERQGSFQLEMMAAARSLGRVVYKLEPSLEAVFLEISAGNPVLVLQNLGLDSLPRWHFAVIKGFDSNAAELILNSGVTEDYRVSLPLFERTWARAQRWAITVTRVDNVPSTAEPDSYFASLVDLEHSAQNFETISPAYRATLEHWPEHKELLMGQGNLLMSQERHSLAIGRFRRVLKNYPDFAPAHNNLAHSLLQTGQLELAEQHARLAVASGGRFQQIYCRTLEAIVAQQNQFIGQ